MSKKIQARIKCSKCKKDTEISLYRSLWIEHQDNRDLVFSDKVNYFSCSCGYGERLEFPFLCTNVKKRFAIWYEPYSDKEIDNDIEQFKKNMGPDSFYAKAPRIKDWNEFKKAILEFEKRINPSGVRMSPETKGIFGKFLEKFKKK